MRVIIEKDYASQCRAAADLIERVIKEKPDCRLGLATGSSPLGIYRELARRCAAEGLDFSGVCAINLDEYVGLAPEHPQSYRNYMDRELFSHVNIDPRRTYVPRGDIDPEESVRQFREVIGRRETDLMLLGLGADGHLGFNEPGESLHVHAHLEELDERTVKANSRFFEDVSQVPRYALTMGMGDIMLARRLLLIVSGSGKEEAASRLLLGGEVTTRWPVTFMKLHRDAVVVITQELADAIGYRG